MVCFLHPLSFEVLTKSVDMDKMVSIKGLVIRTTPVIPDMKTGKNSLGKNTSALLTLL